MTLTANEVRIIQSDPRAIDWTGKKLKVDGDYGARTQWWHGVSMLPEKRIQIILAMLRYHGKKEDARTPNRAGWLDAIQKPFGIGLGNPWCIMLQSTYLREVLPDWPRHASAYDLLNWAKAEGRITKEPLPGDVYGFLYNPNEKGFTPGHGGGILAHNADWSCVFDGNVGNTAKTGKRANLGLTFIRTVDPENPPLIMPPLTDLQNLDGVARSATLAGTR